MTAFVDRAYRDPLKLITEASDAKILSLWNQKLNTEEIARYTMLDESVVARRLAQIRDKK